MRRTTLICCTALLSTVPSLSPWVRIPEENVELAMRNTPLLVARQTLRLARSRVVAHCYAEAVPPLLTAADALAFFEEQEIGRYDGVGADAGEMRQEILEYTRGIATDNSNALSNIDTWLEQIGRWRERRTLSGSFAANKRR